MCILKYLIFIVQPHSIPEMGGSSPEANKKSGGRVNPGRMAGKLLEVRPVKAFHV